MNVTVELSNGSSEHWFPKLTDMERWCRAALETADHQQDAELSLRLVDEEEGRQLNRQYRSKDYATNVLSFPLHLPAGLDENSRPPLLGDIVICPAVVANEASEQHKSLSNHWAHLIIHGTLHLLGHEHEDDASAEAMECLEIKALQMLGIANPYLVG